MSTFKDHFSGHADAYAAARPTYPTELFSWLARQAPDHAVAWDAGCGNGQAAVALAAWFERVEASDPSAEQIARARPHPRVHYRVARAEDGGLPDAGVSLLTVAQALHWFDQPAFAAEAARVLKPGGVLAAWTYACCRVDAAVDAVFDVLYEDILGEWWTPERKLVDNGYRDIALPWPELADIPAFEIALDWTLPQYLDYLRSWSSTQRCLRATGVDAVATLATDFTRAWGDPAQVRRVRWPIAMRAVRRPARSGPG